MRTRAELLHGLAVSLPVVAAWLVDALIPLWTPLAWRAVGSVYSPSLPIVALPAGSAPSDVRSCVPALFMALIAGGMSALPVEPTSGASTGHRRRSCSSATS